MARPWSPPASDTAFWDARTAPLLRFLSRHRSLEELEAWALSWRWSHDLVNMLAYLEIRERAQGNANGWQRIEREENDNERKRFYRG